MSMSVALSNFLRTSSHPYITDWLQAPTEFETQAIFNRSGTQIEGDRYEDLETAERWGPVRWPRHADSVPEAFDPPINCILDRRLKAVGSTWWRWKTRQTIRVGFDIDSLIGHAPGVGRGDEVIALFDTIHLPYITVLRSTRGLGRHIYIEFGDPYPVTENHTEHAAIARALIPRLSRETGIDFGANKDVCGGNMWFWSANASENGYEVVKRATSYLTADDVPVNWRDHLPVLSGSRARVVVRGYTPDGEVTLDLDEQTQAEERVPLDDTHERILSELEKTGYSVIWDTDHHLCRTHTCALAEVHKKLGLRGVFVTNSSGDDPGKPNSFMRPKPDGGWHVYRFGQTQEHPSWTHGTFTHTPYNQPAQLQQLAALCEAEEHVDGRSQVLPSREAVEKLLGLVKSKVKLPSIVDDNRVYTVRTEKDKIRLIISKERSDNLQDFKGFNKTPQGWAANISQLAEQPVELTLLDERVRAVTVYDENNGHTSEDWYLCHNVSKQWVRSTSGECKSVLKSYGVNSEDQCGIALRYSWEEVYLPFQPEYPGGRRWNRNAPQFRVAPALVHGETPMFDKYFDDLGQTLTEYVRKHEYFREAGYQLGGDYFRSLIAASFQEPDCHLPYNFLFGGQNAGKNTFIKILRLLLTRGIVEADEALTSDSGWNGMMAGALWCYVDEVDVSNVHSRAYHRLKKYVTEDYFSCKEKFKSTRDVRNRTKWFQFSNESSFCPIYEDDTRITVTEVLTVQNEITWDVMKPMLQRELPYFLRKMLDWNLPPSGTRLRVPVVNTSAKEICMKNTVGLSVNMTLQSYCKHLRNMCSEGLWYGKLSTLRESLKFPNNERALSTYLPQLSPALGIHDIGIYKHKGRDGTYVAIGTPEQLEMKKLSDGIDDLTPVEVWNEND